MVKETRTVNIIFFAKGTNLLLLFVITFTNIF